ncbi:MAG: SiaB family protein kinase [Bacteroidales bacterium]|nr:SiaB family protein kinase [Bacteroidales bacterium]
MKLKNHLDIINSDELLDSSVYFSYMGPIDQYVLRIITDYLNKITRRNTPYGKKLFIILVELLQNISNYSAEKKQLVEEKAAGVGSVILAESKNAITFITGNLIRTKDIVPLTEKCSIINSLDKKMLKEYKKKEMNRPFGANDGAHIGLIQIALSSNKPLKTKIQHIDNNFSYFSITVSLNKKDKLMTV